MISSIIIIGFCCVFASLTWTWEVVVLVFILMSSVLAYLIPVILKYTSEKVQNKHRRVKLIFPLGVLIWILISYLLFFVVGSSWRVLYFVTGIINIISAILIAFN
jgi:MFS family permease